MKNFTYNLISVIILALFVTSFASCGGGNSNSPAGKALEMTGYLLNEDYESFAEDVYSKTESSDEEVKQLAQMLRAKGSKTFEKKGGIDSYELISEKISEDGSIAVVMVKIVYRNGDVVEDRMRMVKNSSGDWKHRIR